MSDLSRRDVLRGALAATALAACGGSKSSPPQGASAPAASSDAASAQPAAKPAGKRILILGGTGFLGPKTVEAALARGHHVTIFNRGKREKIQPLEVDAKLAGNLERLFGNRDPNLHADEGDPQSPKGLEQLANKRWDVVIDNSGYFPRHVGASAQLLAPNADRYIFISSISAYADSPAQGGDETSKLAELADPTVETMGEQFENYGGLKVLSERAATAAFGDKRTAIVRPGFIVGPGDPTDRFTYWPVRIAAGGEVLAPGSPDDPLQWIDVRDLSAWLVHLAETGTAGTFNAVGPSEPARWGDVLGSAVAAAGPSAGKLTWVPHAWLAKHGMGGEEAFPIWTPPVDKFAGFHRWNNDRAEAAGLTFLPVADTMKDLLAWWPEELERRIRVTKEIMEAAKAKGAAPPKMADPTVLRAGPPREREAELLAKFHGKRKK